MLSFQLTYCKNCGSIEEAQAILDKRIAKIAQKKMNASLYLEKSPIRKREAKTLLYYKEILEHLKWNPEYYAQEFDKQSIISRVKSLI